MRVLMQGMSGYNPKAVSATPTPIPGPNASEAAVTDPEVAFAMMAMSAPEGLVHRG